MVLGSASIERAEEEIGVVVAIHNKLNANPAPPDGNFTSLDCFGRKITFPHHATEAVRFALNHPRFVVRDFPGDLDDVGKLTLARRLIREGIIVAFLP
jgi:hypothetical protein